MLSVYRDAHVILLGAIIEHYRYILVEVDASCLMQEPLVCLYLCHQRAIA